MISDDDLEGAGPEEAELLAGERGRHGIVGFLGGLVLGALVGAGIALLVAPERGAVVRRRLKRRWHKTRDEARLGLRRIKRNVEREAHRRRRWLEREGA